MKNNVMLLLSTLLILLIGAGTVYASTDEESSEGDTGEGSESENNDDGTNDHENSDSESEEEPAYRVDEEYSPSFSTPQEAEEHSRMTKQTEEENTVPSVVVEEAQENVTLTGSSDIHLNSDQRAYILTQGRTIYCDTPLGLLLCIDTEDKYEDN